MNKIFMAALSIAIVLGLIPAAFAKGPVQNDHVWTGSSDGNYSGG